MIERAEGLILRTLPLTETSLIVRWITPELGRITTVAKGARRPKSAYRGKLDLFYRAEFTFRRSRASSLHNLAEVGLKETHAFLRTDLDKLRQASYAAQLIEQTTETDTPLPDIYDLLARLLKALSEVPAQTENLLWFELGLLTCLGLQPELQRLHLPPGTMLLLKSLSNAACDPPPRHSTSNLGRAQAQAGQGLDAPGKDSYSSADVAQAGRFLRAFMLQHLGRLPRDREQALAPGLSLKPPTTPPGPQVPPTSHAP